MKLGTFSFDTEEVAATNDLVAQVTEALMEHIDDIVSAVTPEMAQTYSIVLAAHLSTIILDLGEEIGFDGTELFQKVVAAALSEEPEQMTGIVITTADPNQLELFRNA